MGRVETLKDVPDSEVDELVKDWEDEGATVTRTREGKGWTVRAQFPNGQEHEEGEEEDDQ